MRQGAETLKRQVVNLDSDRASLLVRRQQTRPRWVEFQKRVETILRSRSAGPYEPCSQLRERSVEGLALQMAPATETRTNPSAGGGTDRRTPRADTAGNRLPVAPSGKSSCRCQAMPISQSRRSLPGGPSSVIPVGNPPAVKAEGTASAQSPTRLAKFVYVPNRRLQRIESASTSASLGQGGDRRHDEDFRLLEDSQARLPQCFESLLSTKDVDRLVLDSRRR